MPKEQTKELCIEAVTQNGLLLESIKEQTPKICIEAIKETRDALKYINITLPSDIIKE